MPDAWKLFGSGRIVAVQIVTEETRLAVAEGEEGTVADLSATCQLGIWPGDRELMRSDLVMPLARPEIDEVFTRNRLSVVPFALSRSWCTSTLTIGSGVWIRNSWSRPKNQFRFCAQEA